MGVLHTATRAGDLSKIRLALQAGEEVDGDEHGEYGLTALALASSDGNEDAVRVLLEAGAAVDSKDTVWSTAWMWASKDGHEETVRVLIEAGAAVDSKDMSHFTALMWASLNGHEGVVRVLLEAGAAVDSKHENQSTTLMFASLHGHEGAVLALLEAGAAVDSKNNDWSTALMWASEYGREGTMRVLLEAGAAVDSKDNVGSTALAFASENGHEGAVRVLIEAGAAVDGADESGATALMKAIQKDHLDVARVLLEAGAEPSPTMISPKDVKMRRLLSSHRDARRAQADTEAAEAAAAAADALLAEVEAEKTSAESRQAKVKLKKQRHKTKRAEAMARSAQMGGARSGAAPSGADLPSQRSGSKAAAGAMGAGIQEWKRAAGEEEERGTAVAAAHDDPPSVVAVPAEEVFRALEAAGSDGEVGEGGFGKVVAADLLSLTLRWGRVAVKVARGLQAADILQEVATLRLCHHRNVLPLLGYCDDARAPCMVTPLMRGGSLDDRLLLSDGALERVRRLKFEGDAVLDWQQRLSALCDAARGLAHLHSERILHRDVKTANILLEGALRPLPMAHGPPLLVYRAVISDVGLAKVREPTLGGTTTHATTRNLAISMGFVDPSLVNSNQHSATTDAFGIGICILMSLLSEPAAGLMYGHEEDVIEAMEDGTGPLFGAAHAAAGWPSDAIRALAAVVHGMSIATRRRRQPLPNALVQMEALLGAVGEAAGGEEAIVQRAPAVASAAPAVPRPLVSSRGASMLPVREDEPSARAATSAPPEAWSGGELTRMVRQLEVGDADAPLARKRERVTKAYDSMMVRLERAYARQGHAPLPTDERELLKIDLLVPRHLGRFNALAHTLRKWWNKAKHQRDQWTHPPSDKEVQRLVRDVIAGLDGLGW